MLTSNRRSISYPDPTTRADPADIAVYIKSLVDALELDVFYSQGTLATIPVSSSGTPGKAGRIYVATDQNPHRVFWDYGTGWDELLTSGGVLFSSGAVVSWNNDTNLYRGGVGVLNTDGQLSVGGPIRIASGSNYVDNAHGITFGSSSDTNLYRGGVHILKTDSEIQANTGDGLAFVNVGAVADYGRIGYSGQYTTVAGVPRAFAVPPGSVTYGSGLMLIFLRKTTDSANTGFIIAYFNASNYGTNTIVKMYEVILAGSSAATLTIDAASTIGKGFSLTVPTIAAYFDVMFFYNRQG